jgi:hypothetical protein
LAISDLLRVKDGRMFRLEIGLATALCSAALCGCRGDLYTLVVVRGRVTTCEGKPAAGGVVVFYPIEDPEQTGRPAGNPGREARGTVGDDGTFTLTTIGMKPAPGAVTGRHRVAFEMPPTRRPSLPAEDRAAMSPEEAKKVEADFASRPVYPPLPCSAEIQPAEITVTRDGNDFEFKLPPR